MISDVMKGRGGGGAGEESTLDVIQAQLNCMAPGKKKSFCLGPLSRSLKFPPFLLRHLYKKETTGPVAFLLADDSSDSITRH